GQSGDFANTTKKYIPGVAVAAAPENDDRKFLQAVLDDLDSVAQPSNESKELRRKVHDKLQHIPEAAPAEGSPFALSVGENNQLVISADNLEQLRALLGMLPPEDGGMTDDMDAAD
ncbi:MAG: hypothetical protein MHM6MM_003912, partial [Cercozoa sp. M6MM]